ncbi:MAG: IS1380 family transposase [Deltaproteobacteria bacterium]|nr:IS1380 family transposase [Deltaproteobacteria bacterium]
MLLSSRNQHTWEVRTMEVVFEIRDGNEYLSSHSGLALVGTLLNRTDLKNRLNGVDLSCCSDPSIVHSDVVYAMLGLLCLGKPDFDAIEPFRADTFFGQAMGMGRCPSSSTLRQRLDVVDNAFDTILKEESADLVCQMAPKITPVVTSTGKFVPLDLDVSPFDNSKTKKEGVSWTYKGFDGFSPIFSYVGKEGYLVNAELREGKQHCQNDTPAFLRDSIRYAGRVTNQNLLVRMDSGNDSLENVKICIEEKVQWLIKRNLRKEDKQQWLDLAKREGTKTCPRQGKAIWRGCTYRKVAGIEKPLQIVFEVTERTITAKGQILIFPEIEVDTYWASLECPAYENILLYHDHGESEQFHSELKSDMDLERLPSKHFATNALVLLMGMLAYNILRICGQESVREDNGTVEKRPGYRRKAQRRRIRTVMQDLIYMAGRIISHSRKWFLSFGRFAPWAMVWRSLYQRFSQPSVQGG